MWPPQSSEVFRRFELKRTTDFQGNAITFVKHLKKAGMPRLLTANDPTDCC
jgi:hypothetical protein